VRRVVALFRGQARRQVVGCTLVDMKLELLVDVVVAAHVSASLLDGLKYQRDAVG
jgi:hypothetical protein